MYYSLYPKDWKEISRAIRVDRAGDRCEWCGVANKTIGARDLTGAFHDKYSLDWGNPHEWDTWFGQGQFPRYIQIVLTVAHLGVPHPDGKPGNKHDKADCRPENLAALCQRCHLNFDRADHLARAATTRENKRRQRDAERGWVQLDLLG
jgi:hypothetical protein